MSNLSEIGLSYEWLEKEIAAFKGASGAKKIFTDVPCYIVPTEVREAFIQSGCEDFEEWLIREWYRIGE